MTVKQISVFIENKAGALVNVLNVLKRSGIQLIASTIADTAEYGIFRIICDKPDEAYKVLREACAAVSLCDVFAIELDDKPGMAADVISAFTSEGVQVAYLYSFLLGGKGVLIFRTDNIAKASEIIALKGFATAAL